jgi:hypothetical protein
MMMWLGRVADAVQWFNSRRTGSKKAKAKNWSRSEKKQQRQGGKSTKSSCFELTKKSMTKKDTKQGIENEE